MKELFEGYKTLILASAGAIINVLQMFNITQMNPEQIASIMGLLGSLIALTIYDKINRTKKYE